MAHSEAAFRRLGRLVAEAKSLPRTALVRRYSTDFMASLSVLATPARHCNVLLHMAGHLKAELDPASKHELLETIEEYRRGLVPLIVPITLMRHHVRQHGIRYLAEQVYLEPHPRELMLRNHV